MIWEMDTQGGSIGLALLWSKKKREKLRCLVHSRISFFLKKICYEVIVKQFFKKRPANHYLFVCMYMRICMYAWACQLPVQTYPALCAGRKLQIRNEPYHPMCMTTIPDYDYHPIWDGSHTHVCGYGWMEGWINATCAWASCTGACVWEQQVCVKCTSAVSRRAGKVSPQTLNPEP